MNTIVVKPTNNLTSDREMPKQDALLQVSRRVDWRFLLPDPRLGDTAYVGRIDDVLISSLRQFSNSLTIFENGHWDVDTSRRFSQVVVSNPTRSELCQAAELTDAGGFVYVEVDSRWSRKSRVRTYVAAFQQLDLTEPRVYWHWPNFDACKEIVPLHDRAAVTCALKRRGSTSRTRWKTCVAHVLLRARLLDRIVPCFSLIARR